VTTPLPRLLALCAVTWMSTLPAAAEEFVPVTELDDFLALIEGRELRLGALAISIIITPDGQITGSASGWDLTGTWAWDGGYFCREMDWSGTPVPYNCQLVEQRGSEALRFTSDQGAGDSATLNLR
jgi:hypothetical protein